MSNCDFLRGAITAGFSSDSLASSYTCSCMSNPASAWNPEVALYLDSTSSAYEATEWSILMKTLDLSDRTSFEDARPRTSLDSLEALPDEASLRGMDCLRPKDCLRLALEVGEGDSLDLTLLMSWLS